MVLHTTDMVIARSVGILCIAAGFVMGIQGLDYPNSLWMPVALGLIATGLMAQLYALVRSLTLSGKPKLPNEEKERK